MASFLHLRPALLRWTFLIVVGCSCCQAQSLREEADRTNRLIGAAARSSQLGEPLYALTLGREFSLLEPEDELKWEVLRPTPENFNFAPADRLVSFARSHGMQVRGHTLVWAHQIPPWLAEGKFSPAQLHRLLHGHIQTVVSHYRGQVVAWDVVNEAFDENGHLRSTLWSDAPGIGSGPGTAYMEAALRWTHEADPEALLFINEAECEAVNRKSDALYDVVKDFQRREIPLDGIGFQMHVFDMNPDYAGIAANFHRFAALGLQIHITEMDVAVPVDREGRLRDPGDAVRQAEIYRRIAAICLSEPNCRALETWGFTDKYSWIRSWSRGTKGAALVFDAKYAAKPAYFSLRNALQPVPASPKPASP